MLSWKRDPATGECVQSLFSKYCYHLRMRRFVELASIFVSLVPSGVSTVRNRHEKVPPKFLPKSPPSVHYMTVAITLLALLLSSSARSSTLITTTNLMLMRQHEKRRELSSIFGLSKSSHLKMKGSTIGSIDFITFHPSNNIRIHN